jgi:hypothetical protein
VIRTIGVFDREIYRLRGKGEEARDGQKGSSQTAETNRKAQDMHVDTLPQRQEVSNEAGRRGKYGIGRISTALGAE